MSVEKTLAERGARYGKFIEHSQISQGLLDVVRKLPAWEEKLEPDMRQAISTIFDKIARIMNGDPFYDDNWHDIQGYAKLVEDRIRELNDAKLFEPEPEEILTDTEKANDRDYIQSLRENYDADDITTPEKTVSFVPYREGYMPVSFYEEGK